jgi:fibrillarin-like pre-rRNA processing protein
LRKIQFGKHMFGSLLIAFSRELFKIARQKFFMIEAFPGVWKVGRRIYTESLMPGEKVFTKSIATVRGKEYREWDPRRSKAAAAIANGLGNFPIKKGSKVLYLGIASGSTASFFSDIVGPEGIIYGIEVSERSIRELNPVAERRGNIVPILASARRTEEYGWIEKVDVVYQDVATEDQSDIIIKNAKAFLREDGYAMLAVKSRSIDVTKPPGQIYKQEKEKLRKYFEVLDEVRLDPYEKDHLFLVMRPKQ